jgi:hypothetical protein
VLGDATSHIARGCQMPQARTVTLGAGYRRIAGTQDPATYSGTTMNTVTVAPHDDVLLLKTSFGAQFVVSHDTLAVGHVRDHVSGQKSQYTFSTWVRW